MFRAAHRLRSRPQRLIRHRRVPSHHRLRLRAAESHYDRCRKARVEGHRRPVMAEIGKPEILEPGRPGRLAEHARDMDLAVGLTVRIREDPGLPLLVLELAPEDLSAPHR